MNREQAEHILDAYMRIWRLEIDEDTEASLRSVILDAMTQYKASTTQGITWPHAVTVPATVPTNWDGTPKVTCSGVDHAYKQTTGVDA